MIELKKNGYVTFGNIGIITKLPLEHLGSEEEIYVVGIITFDRGFEVVYSIFGQGSTLGDALIMAFKNICEVIPQCNTWASINDFTFSEMIEKIQKKEYDFPDPLVPVMPIQEKEEPASYLSLVFDKKENRFFFLHE